ncbi:tRNA (N6-isopentenyl adenosine(37)-C2)-methylthiotransferase MiaB [Ruficoccus amylovorans]|uniref:tRNA-2-methylthio-N(6)-dimethylallyladenosine synthase n=1 Tax=Ruficoccus amylovorans TaxID=1804625 RepID=A0A842HIQ9_9BACT|nr:tRNA (N6-isopentenyl adenosine(37)-C2)-methylthiotransferase MiaB [Ruficoccus amylovorans]MBC2596292.1 tRNA (N6-isopentenyl adenosine(37)-C2)-methylthiotransferase MiaB [Ruficoccus amylovorans]
MNRVHIKTYGCQMNERDSEAVAAMLRARGYSIVEDEGEADVVLLNTCSVREQAEQKAIGKAGHLGRRKKRNPNFLVGVMGCMAQNKGADLLDRLPDLDLLVGTQKFHTVPDHLDNLIASLQGQGPRPSTLVDLEAEAGSQNTIRDHVPGERQVSAFVSIMQGCNMKCSYCIVPKTRGPERGRPIDDIVAEVEELAAAGTREVTLLGQIVNQYGVREFPFVDGKSPFVQLLERINAVEGIERIRFTSPHPSGFKQDLIDCYGRLEKLCEYIHFPLQSGSDRILKAMRRPYSVEKFSRILEAMRERCPDLWVSTDVIVGYPGETQEDFQLTCDAFERIGFDMAYVFKYSVRPDTAAEPLGDPVPQEIKEERNQILLDKLQAHSLRRNQSLVGQTLEVLVEGPARRGENRFTGRTRGFRKVVFTGSERLVGQLVPVRIKEATVTTLEGELVLSGVDLDKVPASV